MELANMDVHYASEKQTCETPQDFFDLMDSEFHFDVDVCAEDETAKCNIYYTVDDDGLSKEWNRTCWMNPPYGREIGKWMKDFYNYKTYIQAGLQMKVWRTLKMQVDFYYYILIEIEKPYLVNVVYLSEEWIHHSIVKTMEAILKWKSWLGNGCPAGYGEPQEMRMAPWQQKLMEED